MQATYFSLKQIQQEGPETYALSKLLGVPVFPIGFLKHKNGKSKLSPADYFVMQLNLQELANFPTQLPKQGMLYFFVDVDSLQPKVLFADDLDCDWGFVDDINDGFAPEFGNTQGYQVVFDGQLQEGHFVAGDINPDIDLEADLDTTGYVTLLEIDKLCLPHDNMLKFGNFAGDGRYVFLIKQSHLQKHDFSKVVLVEKED